MRRVLLAIDDYNEMVYLNTLLKKLGFDIDSVQNERKLQATLLGFNPQLILTSGAGKQINGLMVLKHVKKNRGYPKIILLVPPDVNIDDLRGSMVNVDGFVPSPVNIKELILQIADQMNLEPEGLLEKYSKVSAKGASAEHVDEKGAQNSLEATDGNDPMFIEGSKFVKRTWEQGLMPDPRRHNKYKTFLSSLKLPEQKKLDRKRIAKYGKTMKAKPIKNLEEILDAKRDFVKVLLKK